jgi:hypothetical protein
MLGPSVRVEPAMSSEDNASASHSSLCSVLNKLFFFYETGGVSPILVIY